MASPSDSVATNAAEAQRLLKPTIQKAEMALHHGTEAAVRPCALLCLVTADKFCHVSIT